METRTIKTLSGKEEEIIISPEAISIHKHNINIHQKETYNLLEKFKQIEEKNKCLRVKFLDWLSNKLLNWSNNVHKMATRINSPCVIKFSPSITDEDRKRNEEISDLICRAKIGRRD